MGRWLLGLWATIMLPFAGIVAVGGPDGGVVDHLAQHLVMIALAGVSFCIIGALRRATASTPIRVTALVLLVVQVLFVIGNLGEAIATLGHGGFGADEHVFDDPIHILFANLTPPAFLGAVALVLVLSVEVLVVSVRKSRRRVA